MWSLMCVTKLPCWTARETVGPEKNEKEITIFETTIKPPRHHQGTSKCLLNRSSGPSKEEVYHKLHVHSILISN